MSRPMTMSARSTHQSMTKKWLMAVKPRLEKPWPTADPPWRDMSMSAWPSIRPTRPNSACGPGILDQARPQEQPEQDRQAEDHQGAAHELGQGELPPHEHGQDDAELDDEVGRGELEGHRRGEVAALAEHRPGQCHGRVRAGRRGRSEPGGHRQALGRIVRQQAHHLPLRHHRLDGRRQHEAEHQRPQDLPPHGHRHAQGMGDRAPDVQGQPPRRVRRWCRSA